MIWRMHLLIIHKFLQSFEKTPTSSRQMTDRIKAENFKEVRATVGLKIILCTLAPKCSAHKILFNYEETFGARLSHCVVCYPQTKL
jgi:hypothetical protein